MSIPSLRFMAWEVLTKKRHSVKRMPFFTGLSLIFPIVDGSATAVDAGALNVDTSDFTVDGCTLTIDVVPSTVDIRFPTVDGASSTVDIRTSTVDAAPLTVDTAPPPLMLILSRLSCYGLVQFTLPKSNR